MKKQFRKHTLRLCALLTALAMLTGCTSSPSGSSSAGSETESGTSSVSSAASSGTGEAGSVSLPITEEKTTLTLWTAMDTNSSNLIDSLGESEFFKQLEERTNIHIEFQHPAMGNEASAYNLMIASGELPDMIKNGYSYVYPNGLDAAVEDGYFMDLTELLPQYAPHYMTALEHYGAEDDNLRKAAYTNGKRMVGVYQLMPERQGPYAGLYVRKDWLDDCGLETPVTFDDWDTMLTAFKDKKGATAPLLLANTGYNATTNALNAGFGVSYTFYQEDGTVKYGPAEEGWKSYVTTMNQWYSKGLIDPDFMSNTNAWPDNAMVTTGKTGAFISMYTLVSMYEGSNEDPGALYVPVPAPKEKDGDEVKLNMYGLLGGYITISADTDKAETCLKWLDYLFSDEGSLFANYGVEGDTFEYSDGEPKFTEKITANEEYSFSQAMAYYTMPPARVCLQDWRRELASVPEKDVVSYDIWAEATTENALPDPSQLGMTAEENAEYAKIMADIKSIVDEKTAQFITGAAPLKEYDSFVASMEQMGVSRAVEIVQTVYDRFQSR